jgi:hypothetical protein
MVILLLVPDLRSFSSTKLTLPSEHAEIQVSTQWSSGACLNGRNIQLIVLINTITDLTKPLPGNSSVSMFKRATIEACHRC